jgi:hypothetical protein
MSSENVQLKPDITDPQFRWRDYTTIFCIIATGIAVIVILVFILGEKSGKRFIKDDGLVQITGLCLVSMASLLCIYYALLSRGHSLSYLMGGYVLLIYAMREADLHKALSPESFATKLKFYLHPDIGIGPKIIGASFLILFVICMLLLLRRHGRVFYERLRHLDKRALYLASWAVIFGFSQFLDKISISENRFVRHTLEEVVEAMAEAVILAEIILLFPRKKRKT